MVAMLRVPHVLDGAGEGRCRGCLMKRFKINPPPNDADWYTFCAFILDLQREACILGRFPETRRAPFWYSVRKQCQAKEGWRPFRCMAYNQIVRRINAMERVRDERIRFVRQGTKP